jgi:hypothetical protein
MDTREFIVHYYLDWISIVFNGVKLQKHINDHPPKKTCLTFNLYHLGIWALNLLALQMWQPYFDFGVTVCQGIEDFESPTSTCLACG